MAMSGAKKLAKNNQTLKRRGSVTDAAGGPDYVEKMS
jgi:hypothetical protein